MGIIHEDAVVIKEAEKAGDETLITVNCPDKTGLGCDLCRVILLFGLSITRGDVQTDGKWCYLVFWVVGKATTVWSLVKSRLLEVCPTCTPAASGIYYYMPEFQNPAPPEIYLLKFWCSYDRKGLLHDVTQVLCDLELTIKRVKATTTPDGRVLDLFFVSDTRELLHTQERREEAIDGLRAVTRDAMISCEIELAIPEATACSQSFLPSSVTEDMFNLEQPCVFASSSVSIEMDNVLSPLHTLVKVLCQDHKGLMYDIMRTLKDYNIQISYGRFSATPKVNCRVDLFIVQADGKKIIDPQKQDALCSRLRMELAQPLRVDIMNRGPDSELLVANPVELSGRGRPLVFHDITLALKDLNINIFSVEIQRYRIHDREWEVYRILLDENDGQSLPKNDIIVGVRNKLMGWE